MTDTVNQPYLRLVLQGSIAPPGGEEQPVHATLHLSVAHGSWGAVWITSGGRTWQEGPLSDAAPEFPLPGGFRLRIVLPAA